MTLEYVEYLKKQLADHYTLNMTQELWNWFKTHEAEWLRAHGYRW